MNRSQRIKETKVCVLFNPAYVRFKNGHNLSAGMAGQKSWPSGGVPNRTGPDTRSWGPGDGLDRELAGVAHVYMKHHQALRLIHLITGFYTN